MTTETITTPESNDKYFEYHIEGLTQRIAKTTRISSIRIAHCHHVKYDEVNEPIAVKRYNVEAYVDRGRNIDVYLSSKDEAEALAARIAAEFDVVEIENEDNDD